MVYTSLSSKAGNYPYQLNIAHLYGNLMNTYGDNGNILMLKYVAEKLGAHVTVDIVSLHDDFDENHYDIAFFGGGQDFEQSIIADDLPAKKESIDNYIQNDGVVLAICGGFQLLGQYYVEASGRRIEGLGVMGHYTLNQTNNRFIGDIKIHNKDFDETYYGFENHQGRTFLSDDQKPLGQVVYGNGNNEEKVGEGVHYKNVFGSYFHGPILSRNANLAYRLVTTALKKKYGQDGTEQWLTTRQYEFTNTIDTDSKNYLNNLLTMGAKELKNISTTQGNIIVEVLDRKNMINKYTAAVIKRTIDYSKETRGTIFNKFSSFVSANQTPEAIEKNAAKSGYSLLEAKDVTTSQHYLAGIRSTRDALKWLFDAKEGAVSPMYECGNNGDNLLLVVCTKVHPIGYRGLDDAQVKELVKAEVMRDKKAEMLIAKANGVKSIAASKAKGAIVSTVNQVTFAAPVFVQATGASEPALSGAVYAAKVGAFSARPVKGMAGVYQFQVVNRTKNAAKFNEKEQEGKLIQKAMQYAGNFMNELYIKGNVVDNRYLFF